MSHWSRFGYALFRPSKAISEALEKPDFLRTALFIALNTLLFSTFLQYSLSTAVVLHFVAVYALLFTTVWFMPSLLSLLIFRLAGKRFSVEAYLEGSYLAFLPFYVSLWIYFLPATVYHSLKGDYTVYAGLVYYDEVLYLALPLLFGLLLSFVNSVKVGTRATGVRWYFSLLVWTISFSGLYVTYLILSGWL